MEHGEKTRRIFLKQKEEKIAQIKLLYDKAHEYKVRHADAWKTEEDSNKRSIRLNNLVELFKICELLKNVVIDQITLPNNSDSLEELKASDDLPVFELETNLAAHTGSALDAFKDSIVLKNNPLNVFQNSNKKKKKKQKKEKLEELEPLKQEAIRLTYLPNSTKPYFYKPECTNGDSKIIKFTSKIPKNQCLYCA